MKLLIILAIIGFAVSAAPTKEELVKKATQLEAKLETDIERIKSSNPTEAKILSVEMRELKTLAGELATANNPKVVTHLETKLMALEKRVVMTLAKLDKLQTNGSTSRPFVTSSPTNLSPLELKNVLLKRATQLELSTKSEITKLHKQNRTAQVLVIQALDSEVIRISDRLKKTTQIELLELLDSELFWLESRLSIEIQSLQAQDKRVERLLAISGALKQRIVSALKLIANTPVGKALVGESKTLDALIVSLKNAKDDKKIDDMELQLTVVEKRVSDELRVMAVPTVKPF